MKTNIISLFLVPALLFVLARASGEVLVGGGGGPVPQPKLDCIPQSQRDAIAAAIAANPVTPRGPHPPDFGPAPYPFQPIAGTVWRAGRGRADLRRAGRHRHCAARRRV